MIGRLLAKVQKHHLNTAIYFGVSVLSKGASLLLIPLYTARLTRAEYASYGLSQTLLWIVPPLISLALGSAFARFFFDEKEPAKRDQRVGRVATYMIALCLFFGVVFELVLDLVPGVRISGLPPSALRFVIWSSACLPIAEIPMVYFRADERAGRFAAYSLTQFAFTAGSTVVLMLVFDLGLVGLLGGLLAGQAVGALFTVVFVFGVLKPAPFFSPDGKQLLREAIFYSIPFIPHLVGNALMVGADRWFLELYNLKDDLGLYTLATQLTMPVLLASAAWNEASSPRFLATWRDGGNVAARAALPRVVYGFLLCGGGALLLIILGMPILKLLVGARFQAAFPLVPWIGLSLVIGSLFSAFVNVITLRKSTRIIPVLTFGAVAVNVALNVVLVPRFGVYGAIGATALALAFRSTILCLFALRELRRPDELLQPTV